MARNKKCFGIDFGTTNSSSVQYDTVRRIGQARYHLFGEDQLPIPSVVAIDKKGAVYTGREAWSRREELSQTCEYIPSIKTLLGNEEWSVDVGNRTWTVVDVAGKVFDALKYSASKFGADIRNATVAIPVGLSPAARKMLRRAARSSRITVDEFISESTAAFFANYEQLQGIETVAVFDWGGGTLDVSVLRHTRGQLKELATQGMPVAGDSIDELIARRVHGIIARERGVEKLFDEVDAREHDLLVVRSEEAKREFTDADEAMIGLMRYAGTVAFRVKIKYNWFKGIVDPVIDDAMDCLDKAITDAGMSPAGIDCVLLVGGSCNMRPLRERMLARFGNRLLIPDDLVWCVSKGAAVLSYLPGTYVSAQDVSIILSDGTPYRLLGAGEPIAGWRRTVELGVTDTSQSVRIVFSGSRDIDTDPSRFQVMEVPGYGFLEERMILEAEIDEDHVFRVRVRSNMRPEVDERVWEYSKLKLSYDISNWRH